MTKTTWLEKYRIYTIWHFVEKVCQSLIEIMLVFLFRSIQLSFIDAVGELHVAKFLTEVRKLEANNGAHFQIFKEGLLESKVDKLYQPLSSDQELKNHICILKFVSYILI